jgi:hypothetical protein
MSGYKTRDNFKLDGGSVIRLGYVKWDIVRKRKCKSDKSAEPAAFNNPGGTAPVAKVDSLRF